MAKKNEVRNDKKLNSYLNKKLLAASGFITGSIIALSPYLAKLLSPKTIYVTEFVGNNIQAATGEFSFKLQGKNQADTSWAKNADLELVYINQKSKYQVKSKIVYNQELDNFSTYIDSLLPGSIYQVQLVSPNNPRYYFSFLKTSQFFSTKNQVEKFSYYDLDNTTILDLDLEDSQNLLEEANLILYYKQVGTNKILTANGQIKGDKRKNALFSFNNLVRGQNYEIVDLKYYFDNPNSLFDLEISPLANRFFRPSPISGKIESLSQKAYGLNSALVEISLVLDSKKVKLNNNEKINLEYYWKDESDNYQFGLANDVDLIIQGSKVYANLDLSDIPGGAKFWISRIWNNSGSLSFRVDKKLWFISSPEVARIKTFVDGNNTSSFDVKFNDQSLLLNGKDIKINFFADDKPGKMLSTVGQVIGNKMLSFAKNLEKEKHFTIASFEILGNITNFDQESSQKPTSTIFFSKNFDPKEKKFFTHATSAQIEGITIDKISEDSSRISVVLDSADDFIKDKIATLYFKVAGSTNLIKSEARAFNISGNKLVLAWDLINLEPGTNYFIDSIGIADNNQEFVNKLYLNFGPNIYADQLNWTTRPAISSITYIKKSETSIALNIAIKNALEPLKSATIKYKELKPGGQTKTIKAQIESNTVISSLLIENLEKGLDYQIESIEIDNYKSSKGNSNILEVSKTISQAQRIFGVHAPLVIKSITNLQEEQTSAKLKVDFTPETYKAIGNNEVKLYYSLAGSSKLLSTTTKIGQNSQGAKDNTNQNTLEFNLSNLEIGSKYNINSIVLARKILGLNGEEEIIERNMLFGDFTNKFDAKQQYFYTKSAIIEVGYDNSYEQRVIATFILADAKGEYNGKTAKLKYTLVEKNGDKQKASSAQAKQGEITAPIVGARIRFDITDLYKQGIYEINENSLEILDAPSASPKRAKRSLSASNSYQVSTFQASQTQAKTIPFKAKLLATNEKKQFSTIPKTANITSLNLIKRTKNEAEFEIEFGRDFLRTNNKNSQNTEKLDDFLDSQKLKVRYKKFGGESQEQIVQAEKDVISQKTNFKLKNLENGQQYIILGFEQVKQDDPKHPKVDIYLDDLDFYKDQIIATSAVIKKLEIDTSIERQAKVHLELKDGGRYTAGKKVTLEIEKVGENGQVQNSNGSNSNLRLEQVSLNGIYNFTFINLDKLAKYKIKSVKFEKQANQPKVRKARSLLASHNPFRSNISEFNAVFVNVQAQQVQEEEIELFEVESKNLEPKKTFITSAQTAKINKIEYESITTNSLTIKLTFDNLDDYLGQKDIELTYNNLSTKSSVSIKEAKVDVNNKTISFSLTNLNPGDKYEIESLKLKNETVSVRNQQNLKKNEFKFEFDKSPNTQAGFEKQFFSPTPNLAEISPESTSETSARITIKLNDKGANWNSKYLQIKLEGENGAQLPNSNQNKVYTAQIINGLAIFEINGLQKAASYKITEAKVAEQPQEQITANEASGNEIEGFSNSQKSQTKIIKNFELEAESATIVDIAYQSDNNTADIQIKFDKKETFLTKEKHGKKRKLKFTFKHSITGKQVSIEKEFTTSGSSQNTNPQLDLRLDNSSQLEAGALYLLVKIEDVSDQQGPKKLRIFKFDDEEVGSEKKKEENPPKVLSKLYFATKPEVISYSITKKDETTYIANFDIVDPLAGRGIEAGGFEDRDIKIRLKKILAGDGTNNPQSRDLEFSAKANNSKISFEFSDLEKNATYKLESLTWADSESQQKGSQQNKADPTVKNQNSTSQNTPNFSAFAIKEIDTKNHSKIEGEITNNGKIAFGSNFIIYPESAKIIKIEKDDKKNDQATITLTFDSKDLYLKHNDYKSKLKLVYYQVGDSTEKEVELSQDSQSSNEIKFKAELRSLQGGNGFHIVGLKNELNSARRSRRAIQASSIQKINFYFDGAKVKNDARQFATLPIINSIQQFRNGLNPNQYDFIFSLKDGGEVFKNKTSLKAKIQYKKVVGGKNAKATIEEVEAEIKKLAQKSQGSSPSAKSDQSSLENSTTFKFTLKNLDLFAQYYIEKIAYDKTNVDNIITKEESQQTNSDTSGFFRFSQQANPKRAFITFPDKVEVEKIEIKPDFRKDSAKVVLEFAKKYQGFLEVYNKMAIVYKNPKGLFEEVQIDKNNITATLQKQNGQNPKVEVEIKNISQPGKYIIDHIKFLDEKTKTIKAISHLELPPVSIKESITISQRSFYTNSQVVAIRKKYIGETTATIEIVIDDPYGSYIGKKVKGSFKLENSQQASSNSETTASAEIVGDEIGKTSKAVFLLKGLAKASDYTINKIEFEKEDQGDQSQLKTPQNIQFNDIKVLETAKASQVGSQPSSAQEVKKFKTDFLSANALGVIYQPDRSNSSPTPWKKAKVRVFFGAEDKPLKDKQTKLKLVYQSSKYGISTTGQKEVDAKIFSADQFKSEKQDWKNNLPDQANFYYEFDLEGLDPGAEYKVIGLLDPQQKIRIIVPNENGITTSLFSSSSSSSRPNTPSFNFNTAPLITKLAYVARENSIKLIFDVENSQKLTFENSKMEIKYKKLKNKYQEYGWQNPSDPIDKMPKTSSELQVSAKEVKNEQILITKSKNDDSTLTRLEVELTGLDKGSWYLIDSVKLKNIQGQQGDFNLFIDKADWEKSENKLKTDSAEKWPTIINTSIESASIENVKTSTTDQMMVQKNGGSSQNQNRKAELRQGWFEVEFAKKDLGFLKDKYRIQLELESVDKDVFYTNTVEIKNSSSSSSNTIKVQLEAKNLTPGDRYTIKNYIFTLKPEMANKFAVSLPQNLRAKPKRTNYNLLTENAIKSIKYEAIREGQTNVFVELFNNNGLLDGKRLTLTSEIDENFGNKYIPESWKKKNKEAMRTTSRNKVGDRKNGTKNNTINFQVKSSIKKGKEYIIKRINNGGRQLTFDDPIKDESAIQRRFYSRADKANLTSSTITNVTTNSADIELTFAEDDAFLKGETITLYLENSESGQQVKSIGSTTFISAPSKKLTELKATFKFDNVLKPGIWYTIRALTSKTVNLTVDKNTHKGEVDLVKGWKRIQNKRKKRSTNQKTVDLEFITEPLITKVTTDPEDDTATVTLEGWTEDLTKAGFDTELQVKKEGERKDYTNTIDWRQQNGHKDKFKAQVKDLIKFTKYSNINLILKKGKQSEKINSLKKNLKVEFDNLIINGGRKNEREFRTTARYLNLSRSNPVKITPVSPTQVIIEVEMGVQDAKSLQGIPMILKYKKVAPKYNLAYNEQEHESEPVGINLSSSKLTFALSNLESGSIYKIVKILPKNRKDIPNHTIDEKTELKQNHTMLENINGIELEGLDQDTKHGKKVDILFSPQNIRPQIIKGWTIPISYKVYKGEKVKVQFNQEAVTTINKQWLKDNLEVKINENEIKGKAMLTDWEWNPELQIASANLRPYLLETLIGAKITVSIKEPENFNRNPMEKPQTNCQQKNASQNQLPGSSITFQSSTTIATVTPMHIDYIMPGLMGFTYAVYDPLDQIMPTGTEWNPYGEFAVLTPYKDQNWLEVIWDKTAEEPKTNQKEGIKWTKTTPKINGEIKTIKITGPPVAIQTSRKQKENAAEKIKKVRYITLYWNIKVDQGKYKLPTSLQGKAISFIPNSISKLPIRLRIKSGSENTIASAVSINAENPTPNLPGFVMPQSHVANPHDAISTPHSGVEFNTKWRKGETKLIPESWVIDRTKINQAIFWSAPGFEFGFKDQLRNEAWYLNAKNPTKTETEYLFNYAGETLVTSTRQLAAIYIDGKGKNQLRTKESQLVNDGMRRGPTIKWGGNKNERWPVALLTKEDDKYLPFLYAPDNYYQVFNPVNPPELTDYFDSDGDESK
ncbi:conserved hypothetical protein [Mesomycoplasma hyopneumoniae 232]|uniref:DUF1410 domain-containing protein n=1 Tax=Mesomycoplasma hyopneumoniae (strain 232) TaxID=295358 RepID=Q600K9_MESH2|nr:DUF1410 domain-containing protein [Mesomycoplasma hyopneumoniae]AAV27887.1 conserved hypothetical protein [Mesomycoplasma hyopneumoniae 232]